MELKRVDPEEADALNEADAIPREVWAKLNSITRKVKSVEILNEVFTMGRVPDNDIQVLDPRLSGKHCKIMRKFDNEGRMIVVLEDSSSNGTYINGEAVSYFSLGIIRYELKLIGLCRSGRVNFERSRMVTRSFSSRSATRSPCRMKSASSS